MAIVGIYVRFLGFFGGMKKELPPKFSIGLEKCWLEDEFPFGIAHFQGRTVKLQG